MAASSATVTKTVQELAAAVQEPPSRYVRPEQDRQHGLLTADEMPEPIPLVDLSRLTDADEADKLRAALQTWGLFLVSLSLAHTLFSFYSYYSTFVETVLFDYLGHEPWNRRLSYGRHDERVQRVLSATDQREEEMQQLGGGGQALRGGRVWK
jgi:hypothetical protein